MSAAALVRCASCGRRLKAFAFCLHTPAGDRGYGPKCAKDVALQAVRLASASSVCTAADVQTARDLVKQNGWDGKRLVKPRANGATVARRPRAANPSQMSLLEAV